MSRDQACRNSPSTNENCNPSQQPINRCDEGAQQPMGASENQNNPSVGAIRTQEISRNTNTCVGCGLLIFDRIIFSAMDQKWHNACLRCHCCGGRLAEMGTSLFNRGNMILCRQDYLRIFGSAGVCSACQTAIAPDEMVMRCNASTVYHLKCFTCAHCHSPLLPGERYVLINGSPFCEQEFGRVLQGTPPPPPLQQQSSGTGIQTSSVNSAEIPPTVMTPPIFAPGGIGSPVFCGNQENPTNTGSGRVTPRQRKTDTARCPLQVC
ncbi:unnamed protein product [Rodentolepis nana]|uniref:LIM zinc-binding domain-containing protein n=1 Tax=Rodentolepis nana TaxID=102285 RepID=A0A0R3TU32_RODNA|nr:unnamed protein product [Rodentolepis nana]